MPTKKLLVSLAVGAAAVAAGFAVSGMARADAHDQGPRPGSVQGSGPSEPLGPDENPQPLPDRYTDGHQVPVMPDISLDD